MMKFSCCQYLFYKCYIKSFQFLVNTHYLTKTRSPINCFGIISSSHVICTSKLYSTQYKFQLDQQKYRIDYENLYAHEILENNSVYAETVLSHPLKTIVSKNYSHIYSDNEVFNKFYKVTVNNFETKKTLMDPQFTDLTTLLINDISNANFHDISFVLFCLCLWPPCPTTHSPNFKSLWNCLDHRCTDQLKVWSVIQKLIIGDYWFHLRLSRISMYNANLIKNLASESDRLSHNQFVQLMFFVNLQRSVPQSLLYSFDNKLESTVNTVSIEEISIICLGYFKNEVRITNNKVLKAIMERTILKMSEIDRVTIVRILKLLRISFRNDVIELCVSFINYCAINLQRWDLLAAVHTCLFSSKACIYDKLLLDNVIAKLQDLLPEARTKDISKLVQCLAQFNYMSNSSFHDLLFEEIAKPYRLKEHEAHPRDFLTILVFYAYMGKYPLNVIKYALSSKFVKLCLNVRDDEIIRSLAFLDCCIEIECKEYDGQRLSPNLLNVLHTHNANKNSTPETGNSVIIKATQNVMNSLNTLLDPNNFTLVNALPHMYNPDIIIRLSPINSCMSVKQIIDSLSSEIISPPVDETWGCFIICGPFSYSYKTKRLCGLINLKKRQLLKLGYKVVLIPFQDVMVNNSQYHHDYLRKKLSTLCEND